MKWSIVGVSGAVGILVSAPAWGQAKVEVKPGGNPGETFYTFPDGTRSMTAVRTIRNDRGEIIGSTTIVSGTTAADHMPLGVFIVYDNNGIVQSIVTSDHDPKTLERFLNKYKADVEAAGAKGTPVPPKADGSPPPPPSANPPGRQEGVRQRPLSGGRSGGRDVLSSARERGVPIVRGGLTPSRGGGWGGGGGGGGGSMPKITVTGQRQR